MDVDTGRTVHIHTMVHQNIQYHSNGYVELTSYTQHSLIFGG
jgi:hypothetical protein